MNGQMELNVKVANGRHRHESLPPREKDQITIGASTTEETFTNVAVTRIASCAFSRKFWALPIMKRILSRPGSYENDFPRVVHGT